MKLFAKFQIYFLFMFMLSLLLACEDTKTTENENQQNSLTRKQDSVLSRNIKYPEQEIKLSLKAEAVAEKWMIYVAMESEIKRMKAYSLNDVITNAPSILRVSDSLLKTVPKAFRIKPIESRIKVLHTKVSVLNQLAEKQHIDYDKLFKTANEVPVDFYNLNIQLNEAFIEMPNLNL